MDHENFQKLQVEVEKLRRQNKILVERDQNLELQKEKVNELQSLANKQASMLQKYYLVCSEHDVLVDVHKKL